MDVVVIEAKSNEGCAVLINARSHASSSSTFQGLRFHELKVDQNSQDPNKVKRT